MQLCGTNIMLAYDSNYDSHTQYQSLTDSQIFDVNHTGFLFTDWETGFFLKVTIAVYSLPYYSYCRTALNAIQFRRILCISITNQSNVLNLKHT